MGDHFRLVINDITCKKTERPMPNLPVATAFWTPKPDFLTGVEAWLMTGGAHHTVMTYDLTAEQLGDWGDAMGIEVVYIDENTTIRQLKKELKGGKYGKMKIGNKKRRRKIEQDRSSLWIFQQRLEYGFYQTD